MATAAEKWAGRAARAGSALALGFVGGFAVAYVVAWTSLVSGGAEAEVVTLTFAAALYVGGPVGAILGTFTFFVWLRRVPLLLAGALSGLGAMCLGVFFGLFGNLAGGLVGSFMGFFTAAVWLKLRFGFTGTSPQ